MRKPVRMEDLQRHYQRTAIRLIDDSRTARNILTLCSIQIAADLRGSAEHQLNPRRSIFGIKMERTSQWPVRFYRFLTGTHYRIFYNLVLWTHVFLAFAEPDTLDDLQGKSVDDPYIFDFLRRLIVCCSSVCLSFRTMCSGVKASVLALEAVCLFIEALDIVFFMTVKYQWQVRIPSSPLQTHILSLVLSSRRSTCGILCFLAFLTARRSVSTPCSRMEIPFLGTSSTSCWFSCAV